MNYISLLFQSNFLKLGYSCEIYDLQHPIKKEIPKNHFYFLYCLFCIEDLSILPYKQYIIYQLEQHTDEKLNRHYTNIEKKQLEEIYRNSFLCFDYCTQNINILTQELKITPNLLPIPFSIEKNYWNFFKRSRKKYDIIFIGLLNHRRLSILSFLKKYFRVGIPSQTIFGIDLVKFVLQGKILLNLHFYENAILERVRINEMISIGIPLISEKPNEKDLEICKDYTGIVKFIDIIEEPTIHLVSEMKQYIQDYDFKKVKMLEEKFSSSFNKYFYEL